MSNNQNFNDQTDQRVADALATKSNPVGNTPAKTTLGGNLGTAQGAGAGLDGLNLSASSRPNAGTHGTLAVSYDIERSIQGDQSLESLTYEQQTTRIGGGGLYMGSNGVGNVGMSLPSLVTSEGSYTQTNSLTINYTGTSGNAATLLTYPYNPVISTVYTNPLTVTGEPHSLTGVNYTGSGFMPTLLSGNPVTAISAVSGTLYSTWAGLAVTGVNYNTESGIVAIPFPMLGATISYVTYNALPLPKSNVDASGAGWLQSGNYINFTNGIYPTFSGAEAAGKIPPSGTALGPNFWPIYATGVGTFPVSGNGGTAGGYYQSGNYVVFTNNATQNYYFALMTGRIPNSGDTFYTTYSSIDTINPTGAGTNGAGWYQSGNYVNITNGSYTSFNTAANAGKIPASGESFYTLYTYITETAGLPANVASSANYTMPDNNTQSTVYIPNVGNRFAR